jgi:NADH dehydrogenase (ubiquinone) Fe-S protein 5
LFLGLCLFAVQIFVAMASGFGVNGKKGRCYDVWMDFSDCMTHCVMPAECTARRDDYFECLHHRKEYSRMNAINKERERQYFGGNKKNDAHGHQ